MTLANYLKKIKYSDEISVGVASGYLFCGCKYDLMIDAEKIDSRYVKMWNERIRGFKRSVDVYEQLIETSTDAKSMKYYKKKLESARRIIAELERKLDGHTPLMTRNIIDKWKRIDGTTALKLEGVEEGRYWSKEEYREDNSSHYAALFN